MIKYIFFIFIITNTLQTNHLLSCPCEFSCDDERPFFEQYELKNKSADAQKKDEK